MNCKEFICDGNTCFNMVIFTNLIYNFLFQLLVLSDLFTEKSQYQWMLETLMVLIKTHPSEDEITFQYIVTGICKTAAVVGMVRLHIRHS